MKAKNIARLGLAVGLILLIPLIAMQFSDEVNWTPTDFVAAAVLLLGAGFAYEFAAGQTNNPRYRMFIGVAVAAALFVVWLHLAVGII